MKKQTALAAVSKQELETLITWIEGADNVLPDKIQIIIERITAVYSNLSQSAAQAKRTLVQLRLAMGFLPKSERGSSQKHVSTTVEDTPAPAAEQLDIWSPEERENNTSWPRGTRV